MCALLNPRRAYRSFFDGTFEIVDGGGQHEFTEGSSVAAINGALECLLAAFVVHSIRERHLSTFESGDVLFTPEVISICNVIYFI